MLIWMCALHCEAKPIIDYYRLKKVPNQHPFDSYQKDGMLCVVSGIGAINMAAATAWAGAWNSSGGQASGWINTGVAGHRQLEVGNLIYASKVRQQDNPSAIYPVPVVRHTLLNTELISHDHPVDDYDEHAMVDMEAYAFLHTASRFSPLECCQCLKVISDNADTPADRDKARISALIEPHLPRIDDFAKQLLRIAESHAEQYLPPENGQRFLSLAHFTSTQKIQLNKALLALSAYDDDLDTSYELVRDCGDSRTILDRLHDTLYQHSEAL